MAFTDQYTGNLVVLTIASGTQRTTTMRGAFPRYSADGSMLASLTSNVNVMSVDGSNARTFGGSYYAGDGGLTWCPTTECLVARDYSGLAMTIRATGETVHFRPNSEYYQASY